MHWNVLGWDGGRAYLLLCYMCIFFFKPRALGYCSVTIFKKKCRSKGNGPSKHTKV